jgi:hypothetical protein
MTVLVMIWARFGKSERFRRKRKAGCGCPGAAGYAPKETIRYHVRRGERPEFIVRPG